MGSASDRHAAEAGSIPRCGKGFFSQSQLAVQTLPVVNGNTKTPSMHRRLGSATLSQLAFPRECNPNVPWEKSQWDDIAVKRKKVWLLSSSKVQVSARNSKPPAPLHFHFPHTLKAKYDTMLLQCVYWWNAHWSESPPAVWFYFASLDCRWYLWASLNERHDSVWRFCSESTSLSFRCYVRACEENVVATLRNVRTEYKNNNNNNNNNKN